MCILVLQCYLRNLTHELPAHIGVVNAVRGGSEDEIHARNWRLMRDRLTFLDDRIPVHWPRIAWEKYGGEVQKRMLGGKKVVGDALNIDFDFCPRNQ